MTMTLSDLFFTNFKGALGSLKATLTAAEIYATEQGRAPAELLESRLAPDMFTFVQQVQATTDTARRVGDRLCGLAPSSRPDPEPTFSALSERVDATLSHVAARDADKVDAASDITMTINLGAGPMEFTGRSYLLGFALPNVSFHVTTAYAIMRAQGVPLGKAQYITPFVAACASPRSSA